MANLNPVTSANFIEHNGTLPSDDESIAQRIYDYAVKMKLDKLSEIGFDLKAIYRRLNR